MKVTLCGSTRFMTAFGDWETILSKGGHLVYSLARSSNPSRMPSPEEKRRFDLIHLQKIYESDAILVLNVDGYYGDSTRREIEFARINRKDVYWLQNTSEKEGILGVSVWSFQNLFEDKPISSIIESKAYEI